MLFNQFLKGHKAFVEEQRKVQGSYSGIIADNLSKAGWSWGCVAAIDREGRTIFVANAHHVTISPGNSQTKCCSGLSKRLAEDGITIRKNSSILGFSSNPTKKVNSK